MVHLNVQGKYIMYYNIILKISSYCIVTLGIFIR